MLMRKDMRRHDAGAPAVCLFFDDSAHALPPLRYTSRWLMLRWWVASVKYADGKRYHPAAALSISHSVSPMRVILRKTLCRYWCACVIFRSVRANVHYIFWYVFLLWVLIFSMRSDIHSFFVDISSIAFHAAPGFISRDAPFLPGDWCAQALPRADVFDVYAMPRCRERWGFISRRSDITSLFSFFFSIFNISLTRDAPFLLRHYFRGFIRPALWYVLRYFHNLSIALFFIFFAIIDTFSIFILLRLHFDGSAVSPFIILLLSFLFFKRAPVSFSSMLRLRTPCAFLIDITRKRYFFIAIVFIFFDMDFLSRWDTRWLYVQNDVTLHRMPLI